MRFALICSAADAAGINIRDSLLGKFQYSEAGVFDSNPVLQIKGADAKVYTTDKELVYCENLHALLDGDFIIFMSRHKSAAGIPSLSVHSTGNWGEAGLGGFARRLSVAPAAFLKQGVLLLNELSKGSGYDVVQECTHHGPLVSKPSMFIEIGSDEEHWKDRKAGSIIADVIFRIITENIPECESAVGIGGLHTLSNFRKIILSSDYGISHACPKYMLSSLTLENLNEAVENSAPKASAVIVDSKGLGQEKERVMELLSLFSKAHPEIKILKTKDF